MDMEAEMVSIRERLEKGVAILEELAAMRLGLGIPDWGADTEYAVIVAELWDLEEDIIGDPGALEPFVSIVPGDGRG